MLIVSKVIKKLSLLKIIIKKVKITNNNWYRKIILKNSLQI